MVTMLRSDNRKMYSWWWDSHISPKNSKWLQENLTDMDTKVKQIIKLIEVDEDSFARRAEMYYKRRPELMKLVEEFYRAYRALAERYDHATGVIRQAQRTMAEAFPNQIPSSPADDDSPGSVRASDPQTPDTLSRVGFPFDPDELHGDAMVSPSEFHSGKRNSTPAEDLEVDGRKGSKQFSNFLGAEGRVRKGLRFHDVDEKDSSMSDNKGRHLKASGIPESERLGKSNIDMQAPKEALTKLEAEKFAGLLEYQQSLERLSNLESEVSRAQEDSRGFSERASKAEAEVFRLKEALATLEAEREASLLRYQECIDRASNLEATVSHVQEDAGELSNRALSAEKQAEDLRTELVLLKDEKEAGLAEYMLALEKIANLENKLLLAEQDASIASERAEKAEKEVEALKVAISQLTEEKEALALQQQLYVEKIAYLEHEILRSQGEAERFTREIDAGVAKLKGVEEQYLLLETSNKSMQVELDTLSLKVGRLSASVQEERLRLAKAEAAFQSLQSLHSQAQEELRSAAAELQKQVQLLKEMEIQNEQLSSEIESIKDKKKRLNEVNSSAAVLIKNMQEEVSNLREEKEKLQEELELRLDQGNALQQGIHSLKEEIKELGNRHGAVLDQVVAVGLKPECLGSTVRELQDENLTLKKTCQRYEIEITALLEKLGVMENLIEKNASLESSLSNLNTKLEEAKEKVKALEESFQSLMGEKSTILHEKSSLISQLAITAENLENLSQSNTHLENSLSDANAELEALRLKSKNLEDSCRLLTDEKSVLVSERQTLFLQLETSHRNLEELGKRQSELENSLSDANAELEALKLKSKNLEDSYRLLTDEKSVLVSERQTLSLQLETSHRSLEELGKRQSELENSLSDANAELEALKLKSKNLEDSYRLLTDEKSVLVSERQTLSLQLETSHRSLEELGKWQSELEHKYSLLEEEREAAVRIMEELRASLDTEKQERANSDQLSLIQMAHMENQIHSLQESDQKTKEELDAELDKAVNAQLEIYILRKYMQDLKDNNSSLLIEYEKVLEAFQFSEKLISELEREKLDRQLEVRLLADQIKRLRIGMVQFCQALEVDASLACEDTAYRDQMILLNILRKLDDKKRSLSRAVEEHEKLVVEKTVLVALLEQLKHEVADWKAMVNSLSHEFKVGNEKISFLQKDMQKLLESNEELILRVREGNQIEELHAAEIEYLRGSLLDMQSAHQNLERKNHMILKEKGTLLKGMAKLEQEKHELESENSHPIVEGVALDSLMVMFRSIILEKTVDMEELIETLHHYYDENNALQEKMRSMDGRLEQIQMEKTSLQVSLHSSKNELKEVISTKGELEAEIEKAKHMPSRMERERLDAKAMIDNQGKQILELYEKYNQQVKDCELLQESIQILDAQISRMSKQHGEAERALETLGMEVQKTKDEAERWETIAGTLFGEQQSSSVRELLLNEKLSELNEAYKSLEDVNQFNVMEITELRERVGNLEGENGAMKAEMEAFSPVISSLRGCVASLENHTTLRTPIGIEEEKDAVSWQKGIPDKFSSRPANIAELMHVETRIRAVEKALVGMRRLVVEESSNYSTKLQSTTKQLEGIKSRSNSCLGSISLSQHLPSHEELGWRQRKMGSDAYEAEVNELRTKYITLDGTSEASFYGKHRREIETMTDDDILEVRETVEKAGRMGRTTDGKSRKGEVVSPKKYCNFDSKSGHPSTKSLVEKEMFMDQGDISRRSSDHPQEENKKKILERLDSDRRRLNNLQITVQELRKKVQVPGYSNRGMGTEYDRAKEQLVEVEKMILKLIDINSRMLKNVELSSSSYDSLSTVESSEGGGRGSERRREVCEHARKCSEKIGRLDLDLQKIQFILLKHEDGDKKKGSKRGRRLVEWDTRVILRDYLYGGLKSPRRRKKPPRIFCGWARPLTKGD